MKKFTCKEMGGPCDMVFEGETFNEIGEKGGAHIMSSTDDAHKPMREQMTHSSEEDKNKWWDWFKGEWNKKEDAQ